MLYVKISLKVIFPIKTFGGLIINLYLYSVKQKKITRESHIEKKNNKKSSKTFGGLTIN